jgi:hypothetical protein
MSIKESPSIKRNSAILEVIIDHITADGSNNAPIVQSIHVRTLFDHITADGSNNAPIVQSIHVRTLFRSWTHVAVTASKVFFVVEVTERGPK